MPKTQTNAFIQITTELPFDTLLLAGAKAEEGVSRPFRYTVSMLCEDLNRSFDPVKMNGMHVTIGIKQSDHNNDYFFRDGFLHNFQIQGVQRPFRTFLGEVVPWIAFMHLTTDFRIFQNQTVVQILRQVFEEAAAQPPCNKLPITGLLDMHSVEASAAQSPDRYPILEYCVQCRETALTFVSRLMEEYGIFYYFRHQNGFHTLVLRDSMDISGDAHQTDVGFTAESNSGQKFQGQITSWVHAFDMQSGVWDTGNFSFTTPSFPILRQGSPKPTNPVNNYRRYYFPERVFSNDQAGVRIKQQQQEEDHTVHLIKGSSDNCVTFLPGFRFTLHPEDKLPNEQLNTYFLTSLQWSATVSIYQVSGLDDVILRNLTSLSTWDNQKALWFGGVMSNAAQNSPGWFTDSPHIYKLWNDVVGQLLAWGLGGLLAKIPEALAKIGEEFFAAKTTFHLDFIAMPASIPFRPPRTTAKPSIYGPHTALVVGQQGLNRPDGDDICTDQFGRVRVKFPWDLGHDLTDFQTSAWIRVAEPWAGNRFGFQFHPRVGQEVLVEFIDGDPDQPIITGRLYNGGSRQPFPTKEAGVDLHGEPVPSNPRFHQHIKTIQRQSGIKTRSTPTPKGAQERFHLIRFDDDRDNEQLLIRSQGRFDVTAFGPHFDTTYGDRHIVVGGEDPHTHQKSGALTTHVYDEYDLQVDGNRFEEVDKSYQLNVKEDTIVSLESNLKARISKTASINADTIVLEAATKITLKVRNSFVVVTPAGVYASGPLRYDNSGGSPDQASPVVLIEPLLEAKRADPGDK